MICRFNTKGTHFIYFSKVFELKGIVYICTLCQEYAEILEINTYLKHAGKTGIQLFRDSFF